MTVLWLSEPDTSGHYEGLGSPGQSAALRRADAAFGRILDDWQAGSQRDELQVMVASDHGHATISGHANVREALAGVPALLGCTVLPGSSGGIVVPGNAPDQVAEAALWLTRQDWVGTVFAMGSDLPNGVLRRSAVRLDQPRPAAVLYTLRTNAGPAPSGLVGTTLYDGGLAVGAGTHGGLSQAELHTVLLMAGSQTRPGAVSGLPAGLPDIAPTLLAMLGVRSDGEMDGRVLAEALVDGATPDTPVSEDVTTAGDGPGYRQRLTLTRLGRHCWLGGATRCQ